MERIPFQFHENCDPSVTSGERGRWSHTGHRIDVGHRVNVHSSGAERTELVGETSDISFEKVGLSVQVKEHSEGRPQRIQRASREKP